jgi:hypothetical protein
MYPAMYCVKPQVLETTWFGYLVEDIACLHALVFLTSVTQDKLLGVQRSATSRKHLSRTLSLLSERLSRRDLAVTDQTISVVISLALAAIIFGEARVARTHVEGLGKMIDMRGGIDKLLSNRQLWYKACRCVPRVL